MTDSIDIQKLKRGDKKAFRIFFECFYPRLMALACRFVDEHTAKDLVQEVFVSYWENKDEIEIHNIYSFLCKWLQNNCLNYLKHQMVVEEYESRVRVAEARIAFIEQTTDTNEVLKQIITQDIREVIETSVQKLPPKCREIFSLYYFHEMSQKEIAEQLHISVRTVETHVRQAVLFLRKDLKNAFLLLLLFYTFY